MPAPRKPVETNDNDQGRTTSTFDGGKDPRKEGLTYPNYRQRRSRGGHVITEDDTNGHESITIQHRSGSTIQFMPDGAVQITAHKGMLNMVFGENRLMITGAHDVVVKGTSSMLVEGDVNQTVRGNMNYTCDGDFNVTAKNMNTTVRGNIEFLGKTMTGKIEGAIALTAQGNMALSGDGGAAFTSTSGSVAIGAAQDVGIMARGAGYLQSDGAMHIYSGDTASIESSAATNIKSGAAMNMGSSGKMSMQASYIGMDAAPIRMNSGDSDAAGSADKAEEKVSLPATNNPPADSGALGKSAAYVGGGN